MTGRDHRDLMARKQSRVRRGECASVPLKRKAEGPRSGNRLGSLNGPAAALNVPDQGVWVAPIKNRKEAKATANDPLRLRVCG